MGELWDEGARGDRERAEMRPFGSKSRGSVSKPLVRYRTPLGHSVAYELGDAPGSLSGILVLPDPHHRPSSLRQLSVCILVSSAVRSDLFSPPLGIALRPSTVLRASVPKAAIDENCDTGGREDNVHRATDSRDNLPANQVAEAESMQRGTQGELSRRVPLRRVLHAPLDDFR